MANALRQRALSTSGHSLYKDSLSGDAGWRVEGEDVLVLKRHLLVRDLLDTSLSQVNCHCLPNPPFHRTPLFWLD